RRAGRPPAAGRRHGRHHRHAGPERHRHRPSRLVKCPRGRAKVADPTRRGSRPMQPTRTRADLWMDVALVAFLIGFDVVARVLPHAPGAWPVAASALFAGRMLRWPLFSLIVPVGAVALSNLFMPGDHWAVLLTVAAALCVPALLGMLARRFNGVAPTAAAMIASSLVFFAATNFAVWAFDTLYPTTMQGLVQC